jgi:hypothetical protein
MHAPRSADEAAETQPATAALRLARALEFQALARLAGQDGAFGDRRHRTLRQHAATTSPALAARLDALTAAVRASRGMKRVRDDYDAALAPNVALLALNLYAASRLDPLASVAVPKGKA